MKKKLLLIVLTLPTFIGCAENKYNPFKIEKTELFNRVKTVGVMPVFIEIDVNDVEQKKQQFKDNLITTLEQCGFMTIPPNEYVKIYEPLKKAIGPLYDPNTGKLNEEKHSKLLEHAKREYLAKHKPDALAFPSVIIVKANWRYNIAEWHGAKEASTGKEGFWADFAAPSAYGTLPALSFRLSLCSVNDELYFLDYGGIQLYSWVSVSGFVDVPKSKLLTDQSRNEKSVAIACKSLLDTQD